MLSRQKIQYRYKSVISEHRYESVISGYFSFHKLQGHLIICNRSSFILGIYFRLKQNGKNNVPEITDIGRYYIFWRESRLPLAINTKHPDAGAESRQSVLKANQLIIFRNESF